MNLAFIFFILVTLATPFQFNWWIRKSGWTDLQKSYGIAPTGAELKSRKLVIAWCNIGGVGLKNMLILNDSSKGLMIRLRSRIFLLKLHATPEELTVLIPWEDFREVTDIRVRLLFWDVKHKRIHIGNPNISYIELLERDYLKIVRRMPNLKSEL